MGHSYVDYRGRYAHLNDHDLIVVQRFIIAAAAAAAHADSAHADSVTPRVQQMIDAWDEQLKRYAPGCLNPRLDEYAAEEVDRRSLLRLVAGVDERFASYGESIPADVVNALVDDRLLIYGDQPVRAAREALHRFREVLGY